MSGLIDVPDDVMRAELHRRRIYRGRGLCDVCGARATSPSCHSPARHAMAQSSGSTLEALQRGMEAPEFMAIGSTAPVELPDLPDD